MAGSPMVALRMVIPEALRIAPGRLTGIRRHIAPRIMVHLRHEARVTVITGFPGGLVRIPTGVTATTVRAGGSFTPTFTEAGLFTSTSMLRVACPYRRRLRAPLRFIFSSVASRETDQALMRRWYEPSPPLLRQAPGSINASSEEAVHQKFSKSATTRLRPFTADRAMRSSPQARQVSRRCLTFPF